jgi:hypothetical protein
MQSPEAVAMREKISRKFTPPENRGETDAHILTTDH